MSAAIAIVLAWVIGSIPFGYLIVKLSKNRDVRSSGSGGTGATNVSRAAGKMAGFITLVLDATKGAAAVLCAYAIAYGFNEGWIGAGAGIAAVLGHCFPIWLRFKGGKGVATLIGVLLVMCPLVVPIAGFLVFAPVFAVSRFVSLASICTAAAIPVILAIIGSTSAYQASRAPMVVFGISSAVLVIFMHRTNIQRLLAGEESKFR